MAHPEQMQFVRDVRAKLPLFFRNAWIMEIGSRNVNGSVRDLFTDCNYIGIDCRVGDGVDIVCLAHEFQCSLRFDAVVTCETLEHDPHAQQTISMAMDRLRVGGLFVATVAGPSRPKHGTQDSENGEVYGPSPDYYEPFSVDELQSRLNGFLSPLVVIDRGGVDIYAWGIRNAQAGTYRAVERSRPALVQDSTPLL